MIKYAYLLDGECFEEEEGFDTYEEAKRAAQETISDMRLGAEILHISNPSDYPKEDYDDVDIEVIEIHDND